jgi:hypothetical protein
MKILYVLFSGFICFVFCSNQNSQNADQSKKLLQKLANPNDNSSEFLELFKNINPVDLHVFPPTWDKKGKIIDSPYIGIPIDAKKYSFVNDEDIFINIQACKEGNSNIYAIGKFEINDKYTGLLVRQFSQYDESLVQIVLWNKSEKKIYKGMNLADAFGDEGWYFDLESWIKEYKFNSQLSIITRKKDYTPKEDQLTGQLDNSVITDTLKIHVFSNGTFKPDYEKQSDTIKYKLKNWR